jgi:predicted RNA methylase
LFQAFYLGLQRAIVPNVSHVLDLGAGTCLLSMMAAKLGARKVTAIERHPMLVDICRRLIKTNGVEHIVDVINKASTDVVFGRDGFTDLPDVLVSETFDSWIIEEGFFPSLCDIRARGLLSMQATIVPSAAKLIMQLVETSFSFPSNATIFGLDYEEVRRYRPRNTFVENALEIVRHNLTEAADAISFDFQHKTRFSDYFNYSPMYFPITRDGVVHGAMFWFEMYLDESKQIVLSNRPGTEHSSWNQMLHLFKFGDIFVKAGDVFPLLIAQMPSRYVFATPLLNQRLVRVSSTCKHSMDIHRVDYIAHNADGTITSSTTPPLNGNGTLTGDVQLSETYLFSFYGGIEYNVWVVQPGETLVAYVKRPRGDGAMCVDAETGIESMCEDRSLVSRFTLDVAGNPDETETFHPLYEFPTSC